jgi:hypothetical protein
MVPGGDEILRSIADHSRCDELFDPLFPHDILLLAARFRLLPAFSVGYLPPIRRHQKEGRVREDPAFFVPSSRP